MVKPVKMTFDSVKDSDRWVELAYDLKFEKYKEEYPEMDEDELSDKFYKEIVLKKFQYGEYGSFEIIVDEDFNIIGGKIF